MLKIRRLLGMKEIGIKPSGDENRGCLMLIRILIGIVALSALSTFSAYAQVPNTFQPGQPARSAEVNQNFQYLNEKVGDSIAEFSIVRAEGSVVDGVPGAAQAICPSGTIPVSANCSCTGDGTTTNFGVLSDCFVTSNGAVAGCVNDGLVFNPSLEWPEPRAFALCVAAQRVDGSLITQASGFQIKAQSDAHGDALLRVVERLMLRKALLDR